MSYKGDIQAIELNEAQKVFFSFSSQSLFDRLALSLSPVPCDFAALLKCHCYQIASMMNRVKTKNKSGIFWKPKKGKLSSSVAATGKLIHLNSVIIQEVHQKHYEPCDHDGPCSKEVCSCAANSQFCEKFCLCDTSCSRRFAGCNCKSGCDKNQCPCRTANRECDPDICESCCKQASKKCTNRAIYDGEHKGILIGISDIAGWGAFIKTSCKKGDLVCEYKGDIISQFEAERRGIFYDR